MAEPEIVGIGISTIANICVAIGTGLLAFYTYKSVKTSEKQFEIFQSEREKPQALEQIPILNEIQDDLYREIQAIINSNVLWIVCDDAANCHVAPLIFPVSSRKDFYNYFRQSFLGKPHQTNKQIPGLIDSIEQNLHKRSLIYLDLSEKMISLEKEIESAYLQNIDEITSRITILSLKLKTVNGVNRYDIVKNNQIIGDIDQRRLSDIIKSLIISSFFKPLHSQDYRVKSHGYDQLTSELFPILQDVIEHKHVQNISEIIIGFNQELDRLKTINKKINQDIQKIKEIYRDKYSLTGSQLDPIWNNGNW